MADLNVTLDGMTRQDAKAIWRCIVRRHPFFRQSGYQPFGWDYRTLYACGYVRTAMILRRCVRIASGE